MQLKLRETCFEPTDDGTESLDRRGWQQRALGRAGGQNGSTHNLMNVSAINGSNALYQVSVIVSFSANDGH
ncbi:unnamed protein product [Anisakis simplex]|uniref:Uncharacterized protein n=1 Tax=Anisakis simplex TaxID=6269 RepID=A0A0M3J4F4_ANISI|nr:unnamed protein product [Anisakis simplex]